MPVKMYTHLQTVDGFIMRIPLSGGKAGRGLAKTSNVQVYKPGVCLKNFRFKIGDAISRQSAIDKAKDYVNVMSPF
jgi:hypothetical protein